MVKNTETPKEKLKLNSEKIRERERNIKAIKITLLIMLLFLIIIYFLLKVINETGYFTITLDTDLAYESGLVMYEKLEEKKQKQILKAAKVDFMDNISAKWLPNDLHEQNGGSHNGNNYLAYTFYVENQGSETINYWYEILVDDVIKNVDKAIRIIIYRNDEKTIYARANEKTGEAEEEGTKIFLSEIQALLEHRENFKPGDIDKYTIVIYLEGNDPDCVDALIGGDMKMHMDITEEHIAEDKLI